MRDGMLWGHARHLLPEVIAATRGNVMGERGDGGTDHQRRRERGYAN
jgi:hypothetical protein